MASSAHVHGWIASLAVLASCTTSPPASNAPADGPTEQADHDAGTTSNDSGACTLCGSSCVDTSKDVRHCGTCYVECLRGQTCEAGVCDYPVEETPVEIVYRTGERTGSGLSRLIGNAGTLLHFFFGRHLSCDPASCAATLQTRFISDEWVEETPHGILAGGLGTSSYRKDATLEEMQVLPVPGDVLAVARFDDGFVVSRDEGKDGNGLARGSFWSCPVAGCQTWAEATKWSGAEPLLPHRMLRTAKDASGKGWLLAGADVVCDPSSRSHSSCKRLLDGIFQWAVVDGRFVGLHGVTASTFMLGEGRRSDVDLSVNFRWVTGAPKRGLFIVWANTNPVPGASSSNLHAGLAALRFDAAGTPSLTYLVTKAPAGILRWDGRVTADDEYFYFLSDESNAAGDRFTSILRARLP